MNLPSPVEFGAPPKFNAWRQSQEEALAEAMRSRKRFVVLALPTGVGKTVVAAVYALFDGGGTYLTATRGQQDQVRADFESAGFTDVRGMSNYECLEQRGRDCSKGKCLAGENCYRRASGCLYYDAVRKAQASPFVLTNYAFWLTDGDRDGTRADDGPRLSADTLICDEAHLIGSELARHLTVTIRAGETKTFPRDMDTWKFPAVVSWAQDQQRHIEAAVRAGGMDPGEIIATKGLSRRLAAVTTATGGDWVTERAIPGRYGIPGWTIAPVWPEKYMGRLWRNANKVLLVSATVRPKALDLLGLTPKDYDFLEYPSPLPMHRRPIVHLQRPGKMTRLSFKSTPDVIDAWIGKIDDIVEAHAQWGKGIIHTVSYARAEEIQRRSRFGGAMVLNDSRNTRQIIQAFRDADPPAILVSPSVGTGYDFPFDAARWQIIAKIPFPDGRGKVMAERTKQDRTYPLYLALTEVVQMAGRVMRDSNDYGITWIVDDQIAWLMWKHGEYVPGWFRSAYSKKARVSLPRADVGTADKMKRAMQNTP